MGSPPSFRASLADFASEVTRIKGELDRALGMAEPDREALFRLMHTLKSCASFFDADELVGLAHELEAAEPSVLRAALPRLDSTIRNVLRRETSRRDRTRADLGPELLRAFEQKVRAIAHAHGKKVRLEVSVRSKRFMGAEHRPLIASLVHAISNAIHHGIETSDERARQGKSETGTLKMILQGSRIEIEDDGRGVSLGEVFARAKAQGLVGSKQEAEFSKEELLGLLFQPGLSLAAKLSPSAGRGIGLTAILREAEKLGGRVWLESIEGRGTKLCIELRDT